MRAGDGEEQRAQPGIVGIVASAATAREPFPREPRVESASWVIDTFRDYAGSL